MSVTINEIEKILDSKVRPLLAEHNGNITIYSFQDNILKVKLTGKCSGCPSAHTTNEELVAAEIKNAFPTILDVILIEETSQDLIQMARKILNHEV
ncbi:MAG: NifU family protein [Lachnospiraceae bacterium]